jgi:hypothetical protein
MSTVPGSAPCNGSAGRGWCLALMRNASSCPGISRSHGPLAIGAALDLTVAGVTAVTMLDEQFDGPFADQPAEMAPVCAVLRDVLHATVPGNVPAGAGPLARAWADFWARLCVGRSAYWRGREAAYWCSVVEVCLDETRDRARGEVPAQEAYFEQRRKSGVVYPMIGLTEAAYGFEASRRVHEMPVMRRLFEITADAIDTTNDVYSVEKEEALGDVHNLVLVLERERGGARAARVADAVEMVDLWCAEFVEIEHRLDDVCAASHLTADEESSMWRLVDILRSAIRGHHDWYAHTQRYSSIVSAYTDLL